MITTNFDIIIVIPEMTLVENVKCWLPNDHEEVVVGHPKEFVDNICLTNPRFKSRSASNNAKTNMTFYCHMKSESVIYLSM